MNLNEASEEETVVQDEEVQHYIQSLPKVTFLGNLKLIKYQGFWYPVNGDMFKTTLMFQRHFQAQDTDLIIASMPKTGTTWLKSLLYSVLNRSNYPSNNTPLLNHHPHELICRLENDIYGNAFDFPRPHHLNQLPSPRLFHTHLSYSTLPESIKVSGCRVLYITRNPLDTLVSVMHFSMKPLKMEFGEDFELPSIEDYFEEFCEGKIWHGPFFDHVIEYWNKSLEQPNKVLFLKYEDLKEDPVCELKKVADFVGMPFSSTEENEGVIHKIVGLCNIDNLKNLEVNKSGVINKFFEKKSFFRKGEVGEWRNYFSSEMVERMKKLMDQKLEATGLSFRF
ncbi:unnamed protein product [Amaranthus hypochondriacus]